MEARLAHRPGQEGCQVRQRLAAVFRARGEEGMQPMPWVKAPKDDRLQDRKQHRRQFGAPHRAGAVIILPPGDGVAVAVLGLVVVHRRLRMIGEHRQPRPMVLQAIQHLPLCAMQGGVRQAEVALRGHGREPPGQGQMPRLERR